jgi:alkylhydroperoxidase/carboxymuconolactone decarboxylase family protein YurZ
MSEKNPFTVLKEESPQVSEAFFNLIGAISSSGSLDEKTRQLIFIGIMASKSDTSAVTSHVPMAVSAGASREEVRDAVLLSLPTSGLQGITHCLIPALEAFEACVQRRKTI